MKYVKPNLEIILTDEEDIVRTSGVVYDPERFPNDTGKFPIQGN